MSSRIGATDLESGSRIRDSGMSGFVWEEARSEVQKEPWKGLLHHFFGTTDF